MLRPRSKRWLSLSTSIGCDDSRRAIEQHLPSWACADTGTPSGREVSASSSARGHPAAPGQTRLRAERRHPRKRSLLAKNFQPPGGWSKQRCPGAHGSRPYPPTRELWRRAPDESGVRQWPETFLFSSVRYRRLAGGILERETRVGAAHVCGSG